MGANHYRPTFSLLVFAFLLWASARVSGQAASVPLALQAQLLATVAPYDRNMLRRANGAIKILLLVQHGDAESTRAAKQLTEALAQIPKIAGLPHSETTVVFESAPKLASLCREQGVSIVFVTGLADRAAELARALSGSDLLTVASHAQYVENGIVLGFDVVSGKPKLVVNLAQARRQNVAFAASVLRMMKIVPYATEHVW